VNAKEMTSPVVTLGAEVANPWRARCPKRGTPGSEEGVVETTRMGTAPCPYPTRMQRREPLAARMISCALRGNR
jgi:hypothetical protein